MDLENKLKNEGWYLTEAGITKLQAACGNESQHENVNKLIEIAKDLDFREIAGGALPAKRDDDTMPGRIVLQLQKMRVISAPKAKEDSRVAPRCLQLELSDGQTSIMALEMEHISVLNTDIPPGTKFLLRPAQLQLIQGTIQLFANDVQVLGGNVEALAEKWRTARTMQQYARNARPMTGASGPPPWKAFGQKLECIKDDLPNERNFKSLQAASERDKESKENDEFNAMRSEAIAMASKANTKKTFGGGGQVILDHNVKKILEKGYSEEEAKEALRATNNNLERALYSLKRRQGSAAAAKYNNAEANNTRGAPSARGGGASNARESGGGGGRRNAKDDTIAAKPATTNVSLFDFLTDKFPTPSEAGTASTNSTANTNNNTYEKPQEEYNNRVDTGKSYVNSNINCFKDKDSYKKINYNNNANNNNNNNSNNNTNHNNNRGGMSSNGYSRPPRSNEGVPNERPKFENNISSSFAANRNQAHQQSGRREPRGGGNGGGGVPRGNDGNNRDNQARNARGGSATNERNYKPQYPEEQRILSREFRSERGARAPGGYMDNNKRNMRTSAERAVGGDNTERDYGGGGRKKSYAGREQNDNGGNGPQLKRGGGDNEQRYGGNGGAPRYNQNRQHGNNYNNNNNQQQQQHNNGGGGGYVGVNYNNNNKDMSMNKLIESTANMRLDNKQHEDTRKHSNQQTSHGRQHGRQQQHQQHNHQQQAQHQHQQQQHQLQQQQQQLQQQQQHQQQTHYVAAQQQPPPLMTTHYVTPQYMASTPPPNVHLNPAYTQPPPPQQQQMPNGLPYDASKQHQQLDDYTMNVMKSQGISLSTTTTMPQVVTTIAKMQAPPPTVAVAAGAVGPAPTHVYLTAAPPSHSPVATTYAPAPAAGAYLLPSPPAPPPTQQPQIMQQVWPWKVGDRCLAKYWDDGSFYEAEITAVSENTCVVLYVGYGNHEEVLKTDCLPIGDYMQAAQQQMPPQQPHHHRAMKNYTQHSPQQATQNPQMQQQQMLIQNSAAAGGGPHVMADAGGPGGNARFNNKKVQYRLLYVPPPKRKN